MRVLDHIDDAAIDDLRERDEFFWLDIEAPNQSQLHDLGQRFGWHRLVLEDLVEFSQRPKLEPYGDYMFLVLYGVRPGPEPGEALLTEVHLVVSGGYIVTVRHHGCGELEDVRRRFAANPHGSEQFVVYKVLDSLTDTFFPALEAIDDQIDTLEDSIAAGPTDEHLHRLSKLKRNLVYLRRVVSPQRDLAARAIEDIVDLPGLDPDTRNYFRDVYDHLIRVSDLIDTYRDLLTGTMDVYLSTVSNRLNVVMKQLTVIATIFLPLTFVTGFFGQNFGWLVGHVTSGWTFLVYGIGGLLLPVAWLYVWFRRSGFLASDDGGGAGEAGAPHPPPR